MHFISRVHSQVLIEDLDTAAYLCSLYSSAYKRQLDAGRPPSPLFDSKMQPLYTSFIEHLLSSSLTFTKDPLELAYLAAANWPRFLQPWLEALRLQSQSSPSRTHEANLQSGGLDEDVEMEVEVSVPELPDENARMRLLNSFSRSFRDSGNTLYPRVSSSTLWAKIPHSLDPQHQTAVSRHGQVLRDEQRLIQLQGLSRWIALASFFASYNPPRTDQRLFHRGAADDRKKKKGGGTRKSTASRKSKVCCFTQLGPHNSLPYLFSYSRDF